VLKRPISIIPQNTILARNIELQERSGKVVRTGACLILKYYTIVFGVAYAPPFGLSLKHPAPNSDEV